jgi:uncharacterized protein
MKIICIEEHTVDLDIGKAAQPALLEQAPYMAHQSSSNSASRPRDPHRPTRVTMKEAVTLATDLGAGRIKEMDAQGIQMQLVSYTTPIQLVPGGEAVALTRAANDRLAKAIARNPKRLGGFAVLPWQDPKGAVDELSRSINELGLKGVLILGRPGDSFLDDLRYLPVLRKLHELKAPIYVHPFFPLPQIQSAYYGGFSAEVSAELSLGGWGWHHEAGVQVLRLLLAGLFEKLPDLRVISGHWGEMVPFFLARLDFVLPPELTGLSRSISENYKSNVWVTPSGMFDLPHFEFINKVIGADRIIWSTDYPYITMDGAREFLLSLPIGEAERENIAHGNAEKLFGLDA